MSARGRYLILGAVRGYTAYQLRPFLMSLGLSGFQGKLILYTSGVGSDVSDLLKACGVGELAAGADPVFAELPVNHARYSMYQAVLQRHARAFDYVMFTDVRDVLFQRDPFAFDLDDRLCAFEEDASVCIGACPFNSTWVRTAFPDDVFLQMETKPILCSGTTMGPSELMLQYVDAMVAHLERMRRDRPEVIRVLEGLDQGIHNYLLHSNTWHGKVRIFPNEQGPVMTFGHKNPETVLFNEDGQVINEAGAVLNVLHQYDRHPELTARLLARYSGA